MATSHDDNAPHDVTARQSATGDCDLMAQVPLPNDGGNLPAMNPTPSQSHSYQPSTFEALIGGWEDQPRCEMPTYSGPQCRRPARWRISLHGCEHVIMCGQHRRTWVHGTLARLSTGLLPRCEHCGTIFATLADACTVSAL